MGFSGLWRGVLRVILGRRRGADGAFCREIPGFLGGARVQHGDSAHGGHERANWAKNFLKIFKKGVKKGEKPNNLGCERCREAGWRHLK